MKEDSEFLLEDEIHTVFERVIDKHLRALMPLLSAPEIPEAKEAYIRAFDVLFCQVPSARDYPGALDSAAALEEAVGKAVAAMVVSGPAHPNQVLRDWRLLKELGSLIGYVNDTARKVVLREMQVTPDVREKLERADHRLLELAKTIHSDCPYLVDSTVELPASTLRLNIPRWTERLLGDCHLDCDFLLGRSRYMSLHLSHHYRDARRTGRQVC